MKNTLKGLGISDYKEVAKIVWRAEPGTKFKCIYAFEITESVYTVDMRGGKKILRTDKNYRGNVVNGPASVTKIIGRPCRVSLV